MNVACNVLGYHFRRSEASRSSRAEAGAARCVSIQRRNVANNTHRRHAAELVKNASLNAGAAKFIRRRSQSTGPARTVVSPTSRSASGWAGLSLKVQCARCCSKPSCIQPDLTTPLRARSKSLRCHFRRATRLRCRRQYSEGSIDGANSKTLSLPLTPTAVRFCFFWCIFDGATRTHRCISHSPSPSPPSFVATYR